MIYFYVAMIVMQMIVINLYITFKLSKKKYSRAVNIMVMSIYSALLFYAVHIGFNTLNNIDNFQGNGLLLWLVSAYVIPLLFLLNQPIKITLTMFISTWVYTYIIFALSVRFGHIFNGNNFQLIVLLSQTLLHAISIKKIYILLSNQFTYTLWNSNERIISHMLSLSLSLLSLVAISNYTFIEGISTINGLIILFVIISISLLSYNLAFQFSRVNEDAEVFLKKSRTDTLTGLKNRQVLLDDVTSKINKGLPFNLIFLDLDNFKSINDVFGHAKGDEYLIDFTKEMLKRYYRNNFYRISGDEFVVIIDGDKIDNDKLEIENIEYTNEITGLRFLGLSAGTSHFPTDSKSLSDLLSTADYNMYQKKKIKHMFNKEIDFAE